MANWIPIEALEEVLDSSTIDRLALKYGVDSYNQVRLRGRTVLTCLVSGVILHPELSQRLLEETSERITGRRVDHSSFGRRLATLDPAFVGAVFDDLYTRLQAKRAHDGPKETYCLRFVDATIVSLSTRLMQFGLLRTTGQLHERGESRRHVKAVFSLTDEGLPSFLRLCKEQKDCSDCEALGEAIEEHTEPGDLWVFDRGLNDKERLFGIKEAGAFFLTPHNQQALRVQRTLYTSGEQTPTEPPGEGQTDFRLLRVEEAFFGNGTDVQVKKRKRMWDAMPLVVLVGCRYDKRRKAWREFTLLTNLPVSDDETRAGTFTFSELAELYRRRWEIETFFKFLKGRLGYDHLVSRCENGIRVMIYAAMIAALLLIWFKRKSGIDRGWKAVKFWLAENLRDWTALLIQQDLSPPKQTNSL